MTEFQLGCPDCAFSSVITGGWQDALDVAEDHADGRPTLPAGSVVTVRRIADERSHGVASRSD